MGRGAAFLFLILVLLLPGPSTARTLADLQAEALKNRPLIRRYESAIRQRKAGVEEARGAFLPGVDLGWTAAELDEASSVEPRSANRFMAEVRMNLFSGFYDIHTLDARRRTLESAKYELSGIRQQVMFDVAGAMLDVYRSGAELEVGENSVKLYQERYEEARLKQEVGILKKADVLKIKVVMDDALQGLRESGAGVQKSLNRLSRRTGIPGKELDPDSLDFSEFETIPEIAAADTLRRRIQEKRGDLNALKKLREAARAEYGAARSAFYPRADLSAGYARTEDELFFGAGNDTENELRMQLAVRMNVFDGFRKYARIRQALEKEKEIDFRVRELEEDLELELRNLLRDMDVAVKNYEVANISLAEAEENLRINEVSFQKGVATATDILDAIFYLSQARFNIISARHGIFSTWFSLQRLTEGFALPEIAPEAAVADGENLP